MLLNVGFIEVKGYLVKVEHLEDGCCRPTKAKCFDETKCPSVKGKTLCDSDSRPMCWYLRNYVKMKTLNHMQNKLGRREEKWNSYFQFTDINLKLLLIREALARFPFAFL